MVDLGSRTWTSLEEASDLVLLVPVGSCEQHGPHLPLDTDTRIAVALAQAAADVTGGLVAPAVGIGASGEHQSFPGTLSIGTDALAGVLLEVGRSALPPDGSGPFAHVVFVNGHGGNADAATAAVAHLRAESRSVIAWSPRVPAGDAHAGQTETSLMLHIDAAAVGPERPAGHRGPLGDVAETLRRAGVGAVSANGVLGDARDATAGQGGELFAVLVADLAATAATMVHPAS